MKAYEDTSLRTITFRFFLSVVLIPFLMTSCDSRDDFSNGTDRKSRADSVKQDNGLQATTNEEDHIMKSSMIFYQGAEDNAVRRSLEVFSPIARLQELAAEAIRLQDSLYILRGEFELKSPKDTLFLKTYKDHVYKEMLSYKQMITSAPPTISIPPGLLELTRAASNNDSIVSLLPQAKSDLLSHGNFFFLGGAPFIHEIMPEEKTVFTDASGSPETRFEVSVPENSSYLLNSVYHLNKEPFRVLYEKASHSDNAGPSDIYGIGSLKHEFTGRIPVLFLTESGNVSAQLISVSVNLFPPNLGCISNRPTITFACPKKLNEKEILGIYIPYKSETISFKLKRHSDKLWTADMNNDSIPDLACISDTFDGVMDNLVEVLWYVNINGAWKIIDWAEELDCT